MLELQVFRRGSVPLTAAQLRRDDVARAAVTTVHRFDSFLAEHGASTAARLPDGFEIHLPRYGSATADSEWIKLGGPGDEFIDSPARFPEVVGHELAHGVDKRQGTEFSYIREGWADAIGVAFAHLDGSVDPREWRLGLGLVRDSVGGVGFIRDLARPVISTVAEIEPGIGPYPIGGLVTRPAAAAAAELGASAVSRIYADAFLNELPLIMPASRDAAFAAGYSRVAAGGSWPGLEVTLAGLQTKGHGNNPPRTYTRLTASETQLL